MTNEDVLDRFVRNAKPFVAFKHSNANGSNYRISPNSMLGFINYIRATEGKTTTTALGISFSAPLTVDVRNGIHARVYGSIRHSGEASINVGGFVHLHNGRDAVVSETYEGALESLDMKRLEGSL